MTYLFEKSGKIKAPPAEDVAASDKNSAIVVLNCGRLEDGGHYWAYIAVKPSRYKEFMRMTAEHKTIRLDEYGVILKYGFDKDVPADVKADMARNHGFDDNYLSKLSRKIKDAQVAFLKQQENQRISDIVAMLKKKQVAS